MSNDLNFLIFIHSYFDHYFQAGADQQGIHAPSNNNNNNNTIQNNNNNGGGVKARKVIIGARKPNR